MYSTYKHSFTVFPTTFSNHGNFSLESEGVFWASHLTSSSREEKEGVLPLFPNGEAAARVARGLASLGESGDGREGVGSFRGL